MQVERKTRVESELERLRKKVENFPSASAYNRLAELMRLEGDVAGAQQACRRCIKEFPRNGHTYVILADIEMASGKKEEAIKNLITAVERDPRSYTAHRMLADYYVTCSKQSQALHHLRQILSFKANDAVVLQKIEQLTGKPASAPPGRSATEVPASPVPPASGPAPTPAPPKSTLNEGLALLAREAGVRGALVADGKGRVVSSAGLTTDQETMLAAFAAEITSAATVALKSIGQEQLTAWAVAAEQGQVLAFQHDATLSVLVLAEPGVRPAMLELRARQTLIGLRGY